MPRTFDSNVDSGERFAVPTIVCAARWKTVSTSYSPSARATRPASLRSPWTTSNASLDAVEQQRRARRAVALQDDDAVAARHERAREPRAEQPVGAGDEDDAAHRAAMRAFHGASPCSHRSFSRTASL